MKTIFLVSITLLFVITPVAYGQLLSDATGIVNRLDVEIHGQTFEVETVSNFDVPNFEFDENEKKLTLYISSGLENNLGEVIIPHDLLGGNLTFYLNDKEYFPKINSNEKISFATLNFTGSGDNTLEIFGTTYFFGLTEKNEIEQIDMPSIPKDEVSDDSLVWLALTVSLIIVAVGISIAMKIKNKK